MKTMVKLAVLFATLLLLNGIAFAQGDCECYKITFTSSDNPALSETEYDPICLDYGNHNGTFDICDVSLFPGLITQGLIYGSCDCIGFFKFHGNDNNVITGEAYCGLGIRETFWGHITDESNCTPP
jgi:hypothetical protein